EVTMKAERLRRIRSLYEAVLAQAPGNRAAFLDRECAGDAELASEVNRLLDVRDRISEWLSGPVLAQAGRMFDFPGAFAGRELRGYKLIREIGRGGMGCVYLAERADGAYHKQVAIKLVRTGE